MHNHQRVAGRRRGAVRLQRRAAGTGRRGVIATGRQQAACGAGDGAAARRRRRGGGGGGACGCATIRHNRRRVGNERHRTGAVGGIAAVFRARVEAVGASVLSRVALQFASEQIGGPIAGVAAQKLRRASARAQQATRAHIAFQLQQLH